MAIQLQQEEIQFKSNSKVNKDFSDVAVEVAVVDVEDSDPDDAATVEDSDDAAKAAAVLLSLNNANV